MYGIRGVAWRYAADERRLSKASARRITVKNALSWRLSRDKRYKSLTRYRSLEELCWKSFFSRNGFSVNELHFSREGTD